MQLKKVYFNENSYKRIIEKWIPKSFLGKEVLQKKYIAIQEIEKKGFRILESEIVDFLIPYLYYFIIEKRIINRTTKGGIQKRYQVFVAVGDLKESLGIGKGKGREFNEALEKAIKNAKLKIQYIPKFCGSLSCGCNEPHSILKKIYSKVASLRVQIFPAVKGIGLKLSRIGILLCNLAGVKDLWSKSYSKSKNSFNYAKAIFFALKNNFLEKNDGIK